MRYPAAKPSRTSCTWTTLFQVMKRIRITVWISGCTSVSCTGFFLMAVSPQGKALVANFQFAQLRPVLWTGPPQLSSSASHPTRHHTKFTKTSTKTRKPIRLGYRRIYVVPPPSPTRNPRKSTENTKRGQGRGDVFLLSPYASPRGRSLRVHPRSISAPHSPGNRIGFVQAGFCGSLFHLHPFFLRVFSSRVLCWFLDVCGHHT